MNSPTDSYNNLKNALAGVQHIMVRVPQNECISKLDHLKVQSYIMLSHAAFEQYIEDIARQVSRKAHKQLKDHNRVCRALLALVTSEAMLQVDEGVARRKIRASAANDLIEFSRAAVANLTIDVNSNNGITTNDQRKLLLPIGVDPEAVDLNASAALHAFGTKRGDIAHKVRMQTAETRSSILTETSQIFSGLKSFDIAACQQLEDGMSHTT